MKMHSTLMALTAALAISTLALTGASAAPQAATKKTTPQAQPTKPHTTTPGHSGMTHGDRFDSASYKARSEMTRLWAEHEVYVRNYIVCASVGLPETQVISNRLLENANEIGMSLQPYYGVSASQKLTALMRDHVAILSELIQVASGSTVSTLGTGASGATGSTGTGDTNSSGSYGTPGTTGTGAASSDRTNTNGSTDRNMGGTTGSTTTPPTSGSNNGVYGTTRNTTPATPSVITNPNIDKDKLSEVQRRLETNGKNIAAFLNSSNPNWKQSDLEGMLQQHVDHVVAQVTARANGDWQGDLQALDQSLEHTFKFADTLSYGIERQFPDRFAQAAR
ncbi:MAG TPA: hypothetical protein VF247_01505 [Candidatus Krumholzibacteria bacterium]